MCCVCAGVCACIKEMHGYKQKVYLLSWGPHLHAWVERRTLSYLTFEMLTKFLYLRSKIADLLAKCLRTNMNTFQPITGYLHLIKNLYFCHVLLL